MSKDLTPHFQKQLFYTYQMRYISRKNALKDPRFASFICGWQQTKYPSEIANRTEGEWYEETTDTLRFYSQSELNKDRTKAINNFKKITDDLTKQDFEMAGTLVVDSPPDVDEIDFLTEAMASFTEQTKTELIFLPLFKVPWFKDSIDGHHPSTKTAYYNLKKYIGKQEYDGGIVVSAASELRQMLPDYFNLIQGNYYGYNFFYSEDLKTVFSFHYSGQIWFYVYTETALEKIISYIDQNKLLLNKAHTRYDPDLT